MQMKKFYQTFKKNFFNNKLIPIFACRLDNRLKYTAQ